MSKLAKIRKLLGLSQSTIGDELGVPKTSISAWENGRPIPTKHVRKLAKILNVTEAELLSEENPVNHQNHSQLDIAIDAVMKSDLNPDVKVKVYEIISSVKNQPIQKQEEAEKVLNCPKCKQEIPVPEGTETLFCVHCGQKIRLKD